MDLTPDKIEALQRQQFMNQCKEELTAWAKGRAWLLLVILAVLGTFGITTLIQTMVQGKVDTTVTDSINPQLARFERQLESTFNREIERLQSTLAPLQEAASDARREAENAREALSGLEDQRDQVRRTLTEVHDAAKRVEVTFAEVEANLNNLRAGLDKRSQSLERQVDEVLKAIGERGQKIDLSSERKAVAAFEQSSAYTVLVFYMPRESDDAGRVRDALLAEGYRSSASATDFSEIRRASPDGSVVVTYTERGEQALASVRELLAAQGLADRLVVKESPIALRRGDVQILFF